MDKLTAIKIKYDDGTYSDEIPVSVLAENVEWDSTHTLVDILGSIDVDVTGTIQDQISQLFNEKVSNSDMQVYVTNSMPAYITNWLNTNVNPVGSAVVVDSSLTIQGAAADAKVVGDNISDLKSAITYNEASDFGIAYNAEYSNNSFIQGNRQQNNIETVIAIINRCTTQFPIHANKGDTIKVTNTVSGQSILIFSSTKSSGWKTGSFDYVVPSEGYYYADIKKSDDSTIAPSDISAQIKVSCDSAIITITKTETEKLEERLQNIDGLYYLPPIDFEIGTMQISASGWTYPDNNTKRVRTKEGVTYHLSVGDIISLSDYTDARFYLGWKNGNNEYKYAGWKTEDYTVVEAGDYVILLANVTEVDQTSIYALFNLLSIKTSNYALKEIEQEFAEQDAKGLDSFLYNRMSIPFTVNEAYISNKFKSNPNRISFDVPYLFNKGSKIDITVATGEKFYMMYFRKVNNTGSKNTDYEYISRSETGWQTTSKSYTATEDVYVYVSAAFTEDTMITKDTVNTKAVETKAYASADVNELPAYWKTYLQTKNGEINAAMDNIGGIGDAFVFYTDPHWGSKNQKHTPQIIQNMLENTALRSVYCGGDVIDSGSGGFTEYCKAFRGIDVFTARGNHDQNPNAQDASDIVPDTEYYNRILKPIEHLVNTKGKLYFYRDNDSEKIRYIFMDSGSNRADTLNAEQITWMQEALTSLSSDWSALVIQHAVFIGAEASVATLNFAGQGNTTINAINAVWSQMQCQFIGIVCGHVHRDYSTTDATYGYPIIATSCDVGDTGRTTYDPVNGATPGTTDEQIMDVFIINKSTRTITVKRIGAGSDRSFTYPARQ